MDYQKLEEVMSNLQKVEGTKAVASAALFAKKTDAHIDQGDILIPKLLLMQGLSQLVADEKAQMGDVINSVTNTVLGGKKGSMTFIPLSHSKTWVRYKMEGASPKFMGIEPFTVQNSRRPWEEEVDGVKYRNDACLNFFVLLESEINDPRAMPYALSFRRTSYTAGKKLATHFAQCSMAGLAPYAGMLALTSEKQQNDHGPYYVFNVVPVKDTPPEYAPKILQWAEFLASTSVKVDDSDIEAEGSGASAVETKQF
jgi:hypothetical protein